MLFNSYPFMFEFVPIVFIIFFLAAAVSRQLALFVLLAASLVFYSGWSGIPWLLMASFTFNFMAARLIVRIGNGRDRGVGRLVLPLAIAVDLAVLVYFKYTNFIVANIDAATGAGWPIPGIVLPIGVSFFTFTQIAFLVDTARGVANEPAFIKYGVFVTYFPHLLAGPIIHHKEVIPQFDSPSVYRMSANNIAIGLMVFTIGLFKKVALADTYIPTVSQLFAGDHVPLLLESWRGTLSYTLQIYFDFSGYSDMAIGLSKLFGIDLPINFNSPYKSLNIIDFWRRWHMTLSRFLRDYLYIPLGGNRHGRARRYLNLYLTMALGGMWHGAGWTFAIWGALHGIYLVINHLWREMGLGWPDGHLGRVGAWALTFLAVTCAWVFFRSPDASAALLILKGLVGLNNSTGLAGLLHEPIELSTDTAIAAGFAIALFAPNTQELLRHFHAGLLPGALEPSFGFHFAVGRLTAIWGIVFGAVFFLSLSRMSHVTEFIYYQF